MSGRSGMRPVVILVLLAGLLAGCADGERLPRAHGPLFPLNAGLWHPTPTDLSQVPKVAQQ